MRYKQRFSMDYFKIFYKYEENFNSSSHVIIFLLMSLWYHMDDSIASSSVWYICIDLSCWVLDKGCLVDFWIHENSFEYIALNYRSYFCSKSLYCLIIQKILKQIWTAMRDKLLIIAPKHFMKNEMGEGRYNFKTCSTLGMIIEFYQCTECCNFTVIDWTSSFVQPSYVVTLSKYKCFSWIYLNIFFVECRIFAKNFIGIFSDFS